MGTAPLVAWSDPVHSSGAVLVEREGFPVVAHYGSVAAEIAVCSKAAGLVDRAGLGQLQISGPAALLGHVLAAAVPDSVPQTGRAICVAGTWCCRVEPERALVAGPPSALARWRQVASRAIAGAGLPVSVRPVSGSAALSVVGPRAARVIEQAGLPSELERLGVASGDVAGTPVTVLREDAGHFLLLFGGGCSEAVWHALFEAGRAFGIAAVGNEALERLHAATSSK